MDSEKISFAEKTSIHGILDYTSAKNKYNKYFWASIVVLAVIATLIEIYFSVMNYLNSPLLTTYSVKIVDELIIPPVYLCPNTAVDDSKIKYKNQYDFVNGFFNGPPDPESGNVNILSGKRGNSEYFAPPDKLVVPDGLDGGGSFCRCCCGNDNNSVPFGHDEFIPTVVGASLEMECSVFASNGTCLHEGPPMNIFGAAVTSTEQPSMDPPKNMWEFFEDITLSPEDFYSDCTVKNRPTNCSTISRSIFDLDYGRCFLLDVRASQVSPAKAIMMVADAKPNMNMTSLITGITVSVVDRYNPLKVSLDKFYVSPGTFTKISLQTTNYKQINVDTGSVKQVCIEKGGSLWNKKFQFVNLTNDKWSCQMECSLAMSYKYCGCITPFEKSVINLNYWNSTCGYNDYVECLGQLSKNNETRLAEARNCIAKCVPLCDSWSYSYSISSAPLNKNYLSAMTSLNITGNAADKFTERFGDQIVLDIAFADIQYTEISQSLSMTGDTFLSNIGGQIGLWLGASLLSVIQLIEFCIGSVMSTLNNPKRVTSPFQHIQSKTMVTSTT